MEVMECVRCVWIIACSGEWYKHVRAYRFAGDMLNNTTLLTAGDGARGTTEPGEA